jgi:hypothetical protein
LKHLGRNQCCGSGFGIRCFFSPWIRDPDPGWIFSESRIQGVCFWWDFLKNPCTLIFCTNKTCSWNYKKQEKSWFYFSSLFLCTVGSGIRCKSTPRIRDGAMVGSGSGINHPGSATLVGIHKEGRTLLMKKSRTLSLYTGFYSTALGRTLLGSIFFMNYAPGFPLVWTKTIWK